MQLRTAGATYHSIAESLEYADESGARKAVNRLLSRTEHDAVGELRTVEGERLDTLQRVAWPSAIRGGLDAIKPVLAVIDRRMKLYGLAAPVRVDAGGVSHDVFAVRFVALIEEMEPAFLHDVLHGLPGGRWPRSAPCCPTKRLQQVRRTPETRIRPPASTRGGVWGLLPVGPTFSGSARNR